MVGGIPLKDASQIFPIEFQTALTNKNGKPLDQFATGFIKIGPRTILTCGHCVGWDEAWYFDNNSIKLNYMFPVDELRKNMKPPRVIRSLSEWAKRYDIAVMVIPQNIPLPDYFEKIKPISIGSNFPRVGENIFFAGKGMTKNIDSKGYVSCKNAMQWNYGFFKILETEGINFAASGKGMGQAGEPNSYTCQGDSGGFFFTVENQNIKIVGLNNSGTENIEYSSNSLIQIKIPRFLSSGINLATGEVQQWLNQLAFENQEVICGITQECD